MISWGMTGDVPVARLSHGFSSLSAGRAEITLRNLSAILGTISGDAKCVDGLILQLFLSRVTQYEGQVTTVEGGLLSSDIISIGEAFGAVQFASSVLNALADPGFSIERSGGLVRDIAKLMSGTGASAKPNQYAISAFKMGHDVIKKDPSSPCLELRGRGGRRITLLRALTDRTSFIATRISSNKELTMQVLRISGLPVPRTQLVRSEGEAVGFWKSGQPLACVIKPTSTDFGIAVSTELSSAEQVTAAFRLASRHGAVIGQEHVEGEDYRILVIDGVVSGVTRRMPFHIVGDGKKTIRALALDKLADRSRDPFYRRFNDIDLNADEIRIALSRQSVVWDDVIPAGRCVKLRYNSNVSSGGEHEDVTAICHPANFQLGLDAASVVGLDVAGVDLLSTDITRPWVETGAKICEVNPTPAVSTPNAPSLLLRRLEETGGGNGATPTSGDHLYINCRPDIVDGVFSPNAEARPLQDLDQLTEEQFFYQGYLCKTQTNFDLVISLERLLALGCPNKNVTAAYYKVSDTAVGGVLGRLAERLPAHTRLIAIG